MPELVNNNRIAAQIQKMIDSSRMGHAFLFAGGSRESRKEIGRWLAMKILCTNELSTRKFLHGNHEDFIVVTKPEDRETIVVSQMEELSEKLRFKPFSDSFVVMIEDADLMRAEAQNKLLKTLEEPISQTVIILLAERTEAILPTVISRCNTYILEAENTDAKPQVYAAAQSFVQLIKSKAPYYKKKALLADIMADKDDARAKALEFIDVLEETLEKELLCDGSDVELLGKAIRQAETGRRNLKQVHSVPYTLKQMCLRV